jgi:cell division protease FtsH
LIATRRNADAVTMPDFTQAIERIVAGIERKNRILGPHERELAATHELGHALTALALPGADKVHKVSIVPHGIGALGYTLQRPSEDRHLLRRGELLDRLAVLLGGRAAEVLVFGEPTTGAADDLVKATNLARDMVLRYGMDSGLGPVVYLEQRSPFLESPADAASTLTSSAAGEKTAQRIDDAIQGLIEQEMKRATHLLRERREILDRCVRALMSKETLDEAQLLSLVASPDTSHIAPADDGCSATRPTAPALA